MPAYTAAKSAVIGLTRGLARDLGPHRIRANIVYPGWIMTERQLALWMTEEGEQRRRDGQCIPDRLYAPDVARMVLWLAADDSAMVTCREFVVDGGWVLGSSPGKEGQGRQSPWPSFTDNGSRAPPATARAGRGGRPRAGTVLRREGTSPS